MKQILLKNLNLDNTASFSAQDNQDLTELQIRQKLERGLSISEFNRIDNRNKKEK